MEPLHVLVTGSSTGIGCATALHFARRGHRVFASARNPEASEGLRAALAGGLALTTVRLDVDRDESVAAAVAGVLETGGHIDVLVNNAGVGGSGPVEACAIERAKQTFETNYFGAVRMIKAVLPGMRARSSGTIVNVTSMAGRVAFAAHSHYCASKFALEGLSEGLAAEVRPFGIRVAIIEPGVVRTPIFEKRSKRAAVPPYQMAVGRLSRLMAAGLRDPAMPEEVAEAIEHAVVTSEPRLRYVVGKDAALIFGGRGRMSDEEWIELQSMEDEDRFAAQARRRFGADLY